MFARMVRAGLFGLFVGVGAASAKPPGPPMNPAVDGHEPTPMSRDFHDPEAKRTSFFGPTALPPPAAPERLPTADWYDRLRAVLDGHLTIPLGKVELLNNH